MSQTAANAPETPVIELRHVDKHFGDLHVLRDVCLSVRRGEVVVVIGPSGSGKSTMCRTINRLETIDSGVIRIDGKPLPQEGKELANLRAEVGRSLAYLGVKVDEAVNREMRRGKEGLISTPDSKIPVWVIPTNEELLIARDTLALVEGKAVC